jgi:transcription antitermination protein NusB
MSTRHETREWIVQFLFQRDFNRDELDPSLAQFWEGRRANPKARSFAEEIVRGVEANRGEIDKVLQEATEHWDLKRMSAVDRNILRAAVYEMLHRADIPPVVSINEAVELAKSFSGPESGRFVNGVLDRVCHQLKRPAREPADGAADSHG